ncbi:transcription factor 7-like 1-B [Synchiropus splendidus]|uniref:transcription factor 7-like 1-B n=1 Tax=Synchiropus splendidus TaxID=270530 RepID=UPI00237E20F1|nr:transcription factor 7-like 1-B [Synchiropus splendidus]
MELAATNFLSSVDPGFHHSPSSCHSMIVCTYDHPRVPLEQSGPNRAQPGVGLASPRRAKDAPTHDAQGNQVICIPSLKTKQVLRSPNGTVLDASGLLEQKKAARLKTDNKKPPNSFMLFMRENRSRVAAEMKISNGSVVCKALGQMWWSLTAQQKEEYYQRALLERRLHEQQHLDCPRVEHAIKKRRRRSTKAQEQDCQPPRGRSCLDSFVADFYPGSITAELPDLSKLYGPDFMEEFSNLEGTGFSARGIHI